MRRCFLPLLYFVLLENIWCSIYLVTCFQHLVFLLINTQRVFKALNHGTSSEIQPLIASGLNLMLSSAGLSFHGYTKDPLLSLLDRYN